MTLDDTIDRRSHPDGVHRNQHGHAIYIMPGDNRTMKCNLCGQRVVGQPFQRTTTFIKVLESESGLIKWRMRQVVRGLVLKEHLQVKAAGVFDSDAAIEEIAESALEAADSSQGADMGTGVHGVVEQIETGLEPTIHPSIKADIAAYLQLKRGMQAYYGLGTALDVECHVVVDGLRPTKTTWGVSGTFDQVVAGPACPHCGRSRYVLDLKTTKPSSFRYGFREIPMQLATYAAAKRYNVATGERTELDVCQCIGWVIHLPVGLGEASLYRADLATGRHGLSLARQVAEWRMRDGLMVEVPVPTADAPAPGPDASASTAVTPATGQPAIDAGGDSAPDIHGLIAMAADRDSLVALWEQFRGNGWTYGHELAAKRRLEEIETAAKEAADAT